MMTKSDYLTLFHTCVLTDTPAKVKELDIICHIALANNGLYQTVSRFVPVPWPLIAAIHFRESNQSFKRHLHNGDPLTDRTTHEPRGRPMKGQPPFVWVESAVDSLQGAWKPAQWDLAGSLEFLERYNGLGYQAHGINSPYLWNYTNKYVKGLYTSDGHFDFEKIERRPGCVAILKALEAKGIALEFTSLPQNGDGLH